MTFIYRDEYQGVLTYSIPINNIKWSSVFSAMENARNSLNIEDYSISQNSLEQVVLKLLKGQTEEYARDFNGIDINSEHFIF